jgi:hypothetical protein
MRELNIQIGDEKLFKKIKNELQKLKGIKIKEPSKKFKLIGFGMWKDRDELNEDWIRRLREERYE